MTSARPVPGLTLEPVADPSLVRATTVRIGAPYHWPSAHWSDAEWASSLALPGRAAHLLRYRGEVAGLVDYLVSPTGAVEITTFGLVPSHVGNGLGGYALTLAVAQAWRLTPRARRVWLHTSDRDHPHALPNYQRRGFRTTPGRRG